MFLYRQVAKLLIHHIWLGIAFRENVIGNFLRQLREVTPLVRMPSHRALTMVRTRRDDVSLVTAFFNDPLAECMHIAEAFWAARLDENENAAVLDSLPKSVEDELA
jgi:hypothetical protein